MTFGDPNAGFTDHHSGLYGPRVNDEYNPLTPTPRHFIQIAMCVATDGTPYRNALDNEGRVWFFGEDDWHPLPTCPQGEVKI